MHFKDSNIYLLHKKKKNPRTIKYTDTEDNTHNKVTGNYGAFF